MSEVYKGKEIAIDSNNNEQSISIDGKKFKVLRQGETYFIPNIAYTGSKSLLDLAKSIIDRDTL